MRRIGMILVTLLLAAGLLAGCGSGSADESSLTINKDGNVICSSVEEFDPERYDADELKEYVNAAVAEYTQTHGADSVKLNELSVRKGKARLEMTYASYEDYNEFNGASVFVGTIEEAKAKGYSFDGNFVRISGKYSMLCGVDDFLSAGDYYVVIVDEAMQIELPREIAYASREDVAYVSKKKASLKKNADILFPEEEDRKNSVEEASTELEIIYTYDGALDANEGTVMPEIEEAETQYTFQEETASDSVLVYLICNNK